MNDAGKAIQVVHLIGSTGLYGAERWIMALMRAMDSSCFSSTLMNLADVDDKRSAVVSAALERGLDACDFFTGGRFNPAAIYRLAKWARANKINVIHGHGFKSDIMGLLAARLAGSCAISTPHGWSKEKDSKLKIYETLDRYALRFMDMVCPLSPELMRGLKQYVPSSKLRLILNGVDIDEIHDRKAADRMHTDKFIIGYIGQLVDGKDLGTLLDAFKKLIIKKTNAILLFVGDGPSRKKLVEAAKSLGLAECVEFLGYRTDAVALLKTFDLFVLPSLSEGIPRCIMEAMAAGVPVVASDIPGNHELVINNETGLLFPVGDSNGLAECMDRIIMNPGLSPHFVNNASLLIEKSYSNRKMATEYSAVYNELIKAT